jgi:hypothetical protein
MGDGVILGELMTTICIFTACGKKVRARCDLWVCDGVPLLKKIAAISDVFMIEAKLMMSF